MRKLLVLLTLAATAVALTMVAAAGTAVADKPQDGNTGKPSNPPCDADHGHPADNAKCQDGDGKKDTCNDGKDNDKDGKTDGKDDECQDPKDGVEDGKKPKNGTEGPPGDPTCSDGVDNDKDGKTDGDDPDCQNGGNGAAACSDGIDNDEDGVADADDASCHSDGDAENPDSYSPDHESEFDCSSGPAEPDGHGPTNYGPLTGGLHGSPLHALGSPFHDALCAVNRLTGGAA